MSSVIDFCEMLARWNAALWVMRSFTCAESSFHRLWLWLTSQSSAVKTGRCSDRRRCESARLNGAIKKTLWFVLRESAAAHYCSERSTPVHQNENLFLLNAFCRIVPTRYPARTVILHACIWKTLNVAHDVFNTYKQLCVDSHPWP